MYLPDETIKMAVADNLKWKFGFEEHHTNGKILISNVEGKLTTSLNELCINNEMGNIRTHIGEKY